MRTPLYATLVAVSAVAIVSGCSSTALAYGDANSIVAAMSPDLWSKVSDDVYAALEPTIHTVRNEKTFTVTYQDPTQAAWNNLRRFRQMFVVGTGDEPWMQPAVKKARTKVDGPGLYKAYDVWARGQQVTLVILSSPDSIDQLRRDLPEINRTLDEQYREWARNRMYMSGMDSALADTLMGTARFSLMLPDVYKHAHQDSIWIFRNDNPDPSELIRQVAVTWKSPIPVGFQPEQILDWRAQLVTHYNEGQVVDLSDAEAGPFKYRGKDAYQIQAIWKNPPDLNWPAAGPFITRAIICPAQDRMYLVDAWLYAPGKEKYEYMIQLQTILDSFRCGTS
ncbi:MAG: DUF4837 family protein [Gemmatimonadetes bacterium]|nr:DUF4837 family protein [Gemmatimonadota bacterium]